MRTLGTNKNRASSSAWSCEGVLRFQLRAAVVVALLPVTAAVRADAVYLRGGEKLIGKVVSDQKAKVVIKSQALGRLEIPRDRIERVEIDPPPAVPPSSPAATQS